MISVSASSMDELKSFWRKMEGDYQLIQKIHLDSVSMDYKMTISSLNRNDISPVLKSIAEKVFEADSMVHDVSFFENLTYKNFLRKVEEEISGARKYPGLSRLVFVWKELQQMEKRMLFDYFQELLEVSEKDLGPIEKVS